MAVGVAVVREWRGGSGSRFRTLNRKHQLNTSNAPSVGIGYGFGLPHQSRHSQETGVVSIKPPTLNMGQGGGAESTPLSQVSDFLIQLVPLRGWGL